MRTELANYEVTPKIVKSGEETSVTIRPLGRHAAFDEAQEYIVQLLPFDESREPAFNYDHTPLRRAENGEMSFCYRFHGEQAYFVRIFKAGEAFDRKNARLNLRVYALREDLYRRCAYRGDFHAHSNRSDGIEAPEIVAANYRKNGFDFFALTDHRRYEPSVECINLYKNLPVDLKIIPGEEVHAPDNHVHIVNFGGRWSVNQIFQSDPEVYRREVEALIPQLDIPAPVNTFEYASCVWVFQKIKEAGGLSIYAHPQWMSDVYHVPEAFSDALFRDRRFDAFEVLGGHELHSNNLQLAYYNEARADGIKMPIVGASDSHGTVNASWFTWLSSIVFSTDLEVSSIQDAVRNFYSVAVEKYPGEEPRVHGPYRLVKFARFLLEEYFPVHDELCFEEGRLMKELILGDHSAGEILQRMQGRCERLRRKYWGR